MKPTHPLHSLLSGNQTDETDVFCSAFLDTINGGSGCITGRQHRRHDDHEPLRKVGRSLEKNIRLQRMYWDRGKARYARHVQLARDRACLPRMLSRLEESAQKQASFRRSAAMTCA